MASSTLSGSLHRPGGRESQPRRCGPGVGSLWRCATHPAGSKFWTGTTFRIVGESSHYQAVQKTKSNVTSPIDLFRTVFLCAAVDAHCAQSLTAHTLTIGRWQAVSQQIHETRVLQDVSGSGDPDELERLSGFWFRWRRATRTESLVSSQALKTWPGQSSRHL